ncbi:FAD-dependent monooxygenase [Endozoicomonas sp. Mp262]|uniref:FAD-dependent monooxygenase n=1 Tax=Endozoicomonas sp. Mp262 TaxID=2919499 RepID=UPI0021D9CB56
MKEQHFDVLIVGAGMVGSALATALGSQKLKVAVFDRTLPEPFQPDQLPDLRVSALSYASEHILRQLGAWEPMRKMRMCPYRKMAVWEKLDGSLAAIKGRPNQTVFDASAIRYAQLGFIAENRVTQLGLHQAMAQHHSIELFCPAEIEKITLVNNASPRIQLSNGQCFTGRLLVGADGANSKVRKAACLGLSQQDYQQHCLVATAEIKGGCQDITWQAFTPTGPESFLPLPDINGKSYASIVWYHHPEVIKQLKALSDDDFISEIRNTFPEELPPLVRLHEKGSFPLSRRHAQRYYRPGVVLAGDAAHTINPLAGQGVNLGFQDMAWLAEILMDAHKAGEDIGSPKVLARYEAARRADNQRMMTIMDGFYHTFSNDHPPLKLIRNMGLTLAGKMTPAVKQVMKYAMGLSGKQPRLARGLPLV